MPSSESDPSLTNTTLSLSLFRAENVLLREPLDGAGNRISGNMSAACRRSVTCGGFRRLRCSFPSVACVAPLAWFASAAHFRA